MTDEPAAAAGVADVALDDTTVLVTGSTNGIGREAAVALGGLGAEVLVHGRDRASGRSTVDAIEAAGGQATFYGCDFADLDAVREFAASIRADVDRLDVLANNAGGYFPDGGTTAQGYEYTIGVNHLAPFLLTHHLLDLVPADGRVVSTSSGAHEGGSLDVDSFARPTGRTGWAEYAQSKLANVLFTRELARRLDGPTATSVHPGAIPGSRFTRHVPRPFGWLWKLFGFVPGTMTPADGAARLVYLAVAEAATDTAADGAYFAGFEPTPPASQARDAAAQATLWEVSEELTDLAGEYWLPAE
jgi:NAD(P)-dependent dehydrogenase (short-subunit alcohol dehydrogenase family)